MPKFKPIILDRSRLGQYADCPLLAYLSMIWDALKAEAEGKEVFAWEAERIANAPQELKEKMLECIHSGTSGRPAEVGTQIHDLIDRAFDACKNDIELVPEWFVENLPKLSPNIAPMAIRHARHVADMIADYHVQLIGLELQVSLTVIPETETTPAVIVTMRYDLISQGKDNLHIVDWKTGWKQRSNSETLDSFQASFGSWLLFKQEVYKEINTIHFWYFETLYGSKAYARYDRNNEHPRLPGLTTEAAIQGRVMATVELFMQNSTEAKPLPEVCAWCDMIQFCKHAHLEAKQIADDPKAFVDQLVVLEAYCKKQKKAATQWIKAKGELVGTKVVYAKKKPTERFSAGFQDRARPKAGLTNEPELDGHFE